MDFDSSEITTPHPNIKATEPTRAQACELDRQNHLLNEAVLEMNTPYPGCPQDLGGQDVDRLKQKNEMLRHEERQLFFHGRQVSSLG